MKFIGCRASLLSPSHRPSEASLTLAGSPSFPGTWEHTTSIVRLETRPTNELQFEFSRAYRGRIYFEQDLWVIKGTWKEKDGTKQGLFACSADGEGGLWLGKLPPDSSLEPFALPTNPLRWSLAFVPLDDGSAAIEGGGCFNDSGDVLGRPILYFYRSRVFPSFDSLSYIKEPNPPPLIP